LAECGRIDAEIGGKEGRTPAEHRKAFASRAVASPYSGLLFAALDGRLDLARMRSAVRTDTEAREALRALGLE
jgi:hypothetical protein